MLKVACGIVSQITQQHEQSQQIQRDQTVDVMLLSREVQRAAKRRMKGYSRVNLLQANRRRQR